jgi:opacity protein-like surface antigen
MKIGHWMLLGTMVLGVSTIAQATDRIGILGLNYTVGPSFIAGGDHANDVSSVEPGVGAGLQYGLLRNLDFRLDYDYIDASLHSQALTFGAQWKWAPGALWDPFASFGLGFGKPHTDEGWDHFSLKLTGGLEHEITSNVSIQPVISYQYIEGPGPVGSTHVIEPGLRMVYYFGYISRT